MAKKEEKATTAVTKPAKTAVGAVMDFAADAGKGMEGADKASFAIPFLIVLQANSPQVEDGTVKNAKPGMLLNSVTNELYTEVDVIPVAFQRRYLAWAPREKGGGFKGEHAVAEVEAEANPLKWKRNDKEQQQLPDGSILKDTRNHFCIILSKTGAVTQAIFSLTSTQIKKSRKWMSRIQNITLKDAKGKDFNPPSFSHIYSVRTVKEENDKGKWHGVEIDLKGPVADPAIYAQAKTFHELIVAGKVEVAPPPSDTNEEAGSGKF